VYPEEKIPVASGARTLGLLSELSLLIKCKTSPGQGEVEVICSVFNLHIELHPPACHIARVC